MTFHYSREAPVVGVIGASPLFMAHLNLKNHFDVLNVNSRLYLGDQVDRSLEAFATPPRAYDVTDLPTGWKNPDLRATGWETSTEAFGTILNKDRLAFAMFTVEQAETELLERISQGYNAALGKPSATADGKVASYRFWSFQDQSLMVSSCKTAHHGVVVTVAMGVKPIMDALRMNSQLAAEDIFQSEQLLNSAVSGSKQ